MTKAINGKVVKGLGGLYCVRTTEEGAPFLFSCRARGLFRHKDEKVLVGDLVRVTYDDSDPENTAVIDEVLPRRSCLIRPPMANLDYLFCVIAAARPAPILETLDKLLAIAEHHGVEPIVIVTKADFGEEESKKYTDLYRQVGLRVFCVSGETGTGVGELRAYLDGILREGRSAAFAGASGVGNPPCSTPCSRTFALPPTPSPPALSAGVTPRATWSFTRWERAPTPAILPIRPAFPCWTLPTLIFLSWRTCLTPSASSVPTLANAATAIAPTRARARANVRLHGRWRRAELPPAATKATKSSGTCFTPKSTPISKAPKSEASQKTALCLSKS